MSNYGPKKYQNKNKYSTSLVFILLASQQIRDPLVSYTPVKVSAMSKSRRQDKRALELTKAVTADLEVVRNEERLG